jgi:hypothetical protein
MTQIPPEETSQDEQSWLYKIVILPKHFGEAIFNLIGKNNATESSKFILGYMLLAALILLIFGIISPESLQMLFKYFFKQEVSQPIIRF